MPKIDVYKSKTAVIPIAEAKKAKAYQCPWTKDIFKTKPSYIKHLRELRTNRMHKRAKQNRWNKLGEDLWNQPTFEDVIKWVELHPEWFLDNIIKNTWQSNRKFYENIRNDFSIKITHLRVNWRDSLSNSHSCPHNGERNWAGSNKEGIPRGYPGWGGDIEYQISHNIRGFGSDLVKNTRIHTGSGGLISNNRYGFNVKFFEADWPGIAKTQKEEKIINIIEDTNFNFTFNYGKAVHFK